MVEYPSDLPNPSPPPLQPLSSSSLSSDCVQEEPLVTLSALSSPKRSREPSAALELEDIIARHQIDMSPFKKQRAIIECHDQGVAMSNQAVIYLTIDGVLQNNKVKIKGQKPRRPEVGKPQAVVAPVRTRTWLTSSEIPKLKTPAPSTVSAFNDMHNSMN